MFAKTRSGRTIAAAVMALSYGLLNRLLFAGLSLPTEFEVLEIVSASFLIGTPLAMGAIVTYVGRRLGGTRRFWSYLAPVLVVATGMLLSVTLRFEALLCVVVGSPIFLGAALIGGAIASAILTRRRGPWAISLLVVLPYLAAPLESRWEQPAKQVSMEDSIVIHADAAAIWKEIVSVPAIDPKVLPSQLIYLLDFPKPISAEIDREGVGAKRHARFERDVSFFEVVTVWEPNRALAFSIEADPAFIPHTAFDQHIIVGGRFYDVLDGRYDIEPTDDGHCRLVLTSTHRLSSPFNSYAGWWSKWVMHQIQGSILQVIKQRAEAAHTPVAAAL